MNTKPVELMTEDEKAAYYMQRRTAILAGDAGILPDGQTCKAKREAYVAACKADPFRTLPGTATAAEIAAVMGGSELPNTMVAPELDEEEIGDNEITNKRCC